MMKGIKNVIFDFGGIIVDLNKQAAIDAFERLGFDAHSYIGQYVQSGIFNQLELGLIPPARFYDFIREDTGCCVSNEDIRMAWNSMLVRIPVERLQFIHALQGEYRLFILSNTNSVHWEYACQELLSTSDIKLHMPFEHLFLSYEMHMMKPDEEIYRSVLTSAHLLPEETLFIDDSVDNCEAAQKLGIQTFHSQNADDWRELFK